MKKFSILLCLISTVFASESEVLNIKNSDLITNFKVIQVYQNNNQNYDIKWNKVINNGASNCDINNSTSSHISTNILYNSKIVDNITKIQIDKNMNIVVSMINSRCFNIKTNYNQKEYNNKFCLDGNLTLFSTPKGSKSTYIYDIDISKPSNESSIQGKND